MLATACGQAASGQSAQTLSRPSASTPGTSPAPSSDSGLDQAVVSLEGSLRTLTQDQALTQPGDDATKARIAMEGGLAALRASFKALTELKSSNACQPTTAAAGTVQARAAEAGAALEDATRALQALQRRLDAVTPLVASARTQLVAAQGLAAHEAVGQGYTTRLATASTQLAALDSQLSAQKAAVQETNDKIGRGRTSVEVLPRQGSQAVEECYHRAAAAANRAARSAG